MTRPEAGSKTTVGSETGTLGSGSINEGGTSSSTSMGRIGGGIKERSEGPGIIGWTKGGGFVRAGGGRRLSGEIRHQADQILILFLELLLHKTRHVITYTQDFVVIVTPRLS